MKETIRYPENIVFSKKNIMTIDDFSRKYSKYKTGDVLWPEAQEAIDQHKDGMAKFIRWVHQFYGADIVQRRKMANEMLPDDMHFADMADFVKQAQTTGTGSFDIQSVSREQGAMLLWYKPKDTPYSWAALTAKSFINSSSAMTVARRITEIDNHREGVEEKLGTIEKPIMFLDVMVGEGDKANIKQVVVEKGKVVLRERTTQDEKRDREAQEEEMRAAQDKLDRMERERTLIKQEEDGCLARADITVKNHNQLVTKKEQLATDMTKKQTDLDGKKAGCVYDIERMIEWGRAPGEIKRLREKLIRLGFTLPTKDSYPGFTAFQEQVSRVLSDYHSTSILRRPLFYGKAIEFLKTLNDGEFKTRLQSGIKTEKEIMDIEASINATQADIATLATGIGHIRTELANIKSKYENPESIPYDYRIDHYRTGTEIATIRKRIVEIESQLSQIS